MTVAGPLAQLLAALILLCGFGLLVRRRLDAQITLLRVQSGTLAGAAACAGYTQHAPQLLLAAAIIFVLQVLLLPALLSRIVRRRATPAGPHPAALPAQALPLALALLLLALLLAPLALAVPLAVLLLGLLALALRRDALAQTIGAFSAETGLMLAAITLPGLPFIAWLALGALALPAAMFAGVVRLRLRGDLASLEFPSLDTGA